MSAVFDAGFGEGNSNNQTESSFSKLDGYIQPVDSSVNINALRDALHEIEDETKEAFPHVQPGDTDKVIDAYDNATKKRVLKFFKAVIDGKMTFEQVERELSNEDRMYIEKNAPVLQRNFGQVEVETKKPDVKISGIGPNGVVVSTLTPVTIVGKGGNVVLNAKKEIMQKYVQHAIQPEKDKMVLDLVKESKNSVSLEEIVEHLKKQAPQNIINTTNKNAYEIRLTVLQEAMKLKSPQSSVDEILSTAEKLYDFVQGSVNNRRR